MLATPVAKSGSASLVYNPATSVGTLTGPDGGTSTIDLSGKADKNNDSQSVIAYELSLGKNTGDNADDGAIYFYSNDTNQYYALRAGDTQLQTDTNLEVQGQLAATSAYLNGRLTLASSAEAPILFTPLSTNLNAGTSMSGNMWLHSSGLYYNVGGSIVGPLTGATTNAALLTSGTLPDARLSSNVALLSNNLAGLGNVATARTNLGLATIAATGSASDLTTGTISDLRLSSNVVTLTGSQTLTNKTLTAPNIGAATGTSLTLSGDATIGGTEALVITASTRTISVISASANANITLTPKGSSGVVTIGGGLGIDANNVRYGGSIQFPSTSTIGWSQFSNGAAGGQDTYLQRDAAGIVAQRNGTNAQTSRIYNTYTSGSGTNSSNTIVGEWLALEWNGSNQAYVGTRKGSSGGTARDLLIGADGATRITVQAAGTVLIGGCTFYTNGNSDLSGNMGIGGNRMSINVPGLKLASDGWIAASDGTATNSSNNDTFLSRASAGIWRAGTTSSNALGSMQMANLIQTGTHTLNGAVFTGDGSGSVGIGAATFTPARTLHIQGGSTAAIRLDRTQNLPFVMITNFDSTYTTCSQSWTFGGSGTTTFAINDLGTAVSGTGTTRLTIAASTGATVINGTLTHNFASQSSDPTTSDLTAGQSRLVKNTTASEIRWWINDGGVMKKSAALT